MKITEPDRPPRGKSRLSLLWEDGDLCAVEEEIAEVLGFCDAVEMSTISGMLQAGSHPHAVVNKILADRRW